MHRARLIGLAASLLLAGAAPLPTLYSAPAGSRPAGAPSAARPYDVILPDGRIVAPVGKSVAVGMNALSVAIAPGGRFAIVGNDDEREDRAISTLEPAIRGGYSLTVVDLKTMRIADFYRSPNLTLFLGLAAFKDPADPARTLVAAAGGGSNTVRFYDLDAAGKLHPENTYLAIPAPDDPQYGDRGHAFPGEITVSGNHRTMYVVNDLGDSVTAIDVASRRVRSTVDVGYFPWASAISHGRLIVTDRGLMRYANLAAPAAAPPFSNVPFTPGSSSALSTIGIAPDGDLEALRSSSSIDVAPDGVNVVGGAHPSAIAVSKNGDYAYVCMTNVDRIAIVDLRGTPHVVGGLQLQLFDRAPYGTQPDAIALSPNGKRVYVALAGMNAIAVLDARNPRQLHRLGLIPTGWYPSGLAVSSNARYLYVVNAKGLGQEPAAGNPVADSNDVWATLQRIDLHGLPLERTTYSTLRYTRDAQRARSNAVVPPLRSLVRSSVIKHVVLVVEEDQSYDAALGNLPGTARTTNLRALAQQFASATNYYAGAEEPAAGHQFLGSGLATAYTEQTLDVGDGRYPLIGNSENPEDYPRAGYIFNDLSRAALSYRDYGDFLDLAGFTAGNAPSRGLGGTYALDVPALAALNGHVDLQYPGWNPGIGDAARAAEFKRDFSAIEQGAGMPDFTEIWLPGSFSASSGGPAAAKAAETDRALGQVVDFLTHLPEWSSTAIFITADDAQGLPDRLNADRSFAIVVSPYAKRNYAGGMHLSSASILKTEEELLGLPPLSLGDLLATDMSNFFQAEPDTAPYSAIVEPVGSQP